jgi:hypothetical protein
VAEKRISSLRLTRATYGEPISKNRRRKRRRQTMSKKIKKCGEGGGEPLKKEIGDNYRR